LPTSNYIQLEQYRNSSDVIRNHKKCRLIIRYKITNTAATAVGK